MSGSREDDDAYMHKRRDLWLDDETEILIQLYGEEAHQRAIPPRKYGSIARYTNIAKKLKEVGYNRSAHQVRNKLKSLRGSYYAAASGTELDRKHCFMYDELDKYFRHSRRDSSFKCDETTQMSTDSPTSNSDRPCHRKRRQFEEINLTSERIDFCNENDNQSDCFPEAGDEELIYVSTRKCKKPRRTSSTNIEPISRDDHTDVTLVEFMSDQLEKQRQHQLEITKVFTNAMSEQFNKFSELITNLTHQMLEISRKVGLSPEEVKIDVADEAVD